MVCENYPIRNFTNICDHRVQGSTGRLEDTDMQTSDEQEKLLQACSSADMQSCISSDMGDMDAFDHRKVYASVRL